MEDIDTVLLILTHFPLTEFNKNLTRGCVYNENYMFTWSGRR